MLVELPDTDAEGGAYTTFDVAALLYQAIPQARIAHLRDGGTSGAYVLLRSETMAVDAARELRNALDRLTPVGRVTLSSSRIVDDTIADELSGLDLDAAVERAEQLDDDTPVVEHSYHDEHVPGCELCEGANRSRKGRGMPRPRRRR
jgi:hypothetical protein